MGALRTRGHGRSLCRAVAGGLAALSLLAAGCAGTGGLYHWGRYEESLYDLYAKADSFDVADEIRRLAEDVHRAESRGRLVPPGVRAHLGYLSTLAGDDAGAAGWFRAEKEAYPESAVLMDGLLGRMGR